MPTIIQHTDSLPQTAAHTVDETGPARVWASTEDGYALLARKDAVGVSFRGDTSGSIMEVLERRGWGVINLGPGSDKVTLSDTYHRRHSRVWRYWITTPQDLIQGVRQFVAAAEAGGLPEGWTEKTAEDADGDQYVLCSFCLGMSGARSLGAEQQALGSLATLPEGVYFFQRVALIDGFSGVEKQSRQPNPLDTKLYSPGDLFQANHPDAAADRGSTLAESDVLSLTGLTLK